METLLSSTRSNALIQTSLKNLVDQLVKKTLPSAVRNRSLIINDISEKMVVNTDEGVLANVISGLLYAVVSNARESCIRVFARNIYDSMVEVSVKDNNSCHTYAIACCLQDVVPVAEQIGGRLDIMNQRQCVTTISFTFPVVKEERQYPNVMSIV